MNDNIGNEIEIVKVKKKKQNILDRPAIDDKNKYGDSLSKITLRNSGKCEINNTNSTKHLKLGGKKLKKKTIRNAKKFRWFPKIIGITKIIHGKY